MSTEYEVRKAIEAAEAELKKQGLILPDEASISAYAKSNNMTEVEARENIEKEFDTIESSVGYDEKIEGVDWTGEEPAAATSEPEVEPYTPTEEGGVSHAPLPGTDALQEENPWGENIYDEVDDSTAGAEGITGQYEEQLEEEFSSWENKKISPFDGIISKSEDPLHRARHIEKSKNNGMCNEAVPQYNMEITGGKTTSEEILNNSTKAKTKNNAWIIVGRDRPAGPETGYGGKGHTRAGAIDIVVGLQGHAPNDKMTVDKNFGSMTTGMPGDAARIYISQRADIDNYFGICDGYVGNSKLDSAIGMKADSVRIMANKGIKIVTGGAPQQKTSLYGDMAITYGIDLIAGNRDNVAAKRKGDGPTRATQPYLQPIPKGLNLEDFLEEIVDSLVTLNILLTEFANRQISINSLLSTGPWVGGGILGPGALNPASVAFVQFYSTLIGTAVIPQLDLHRKELNSLDSNYLTDSGPYYINSRYNRTN